MVDDIINELEKMKLTVEQEEVIEILDEDRVDELES